MLTSFFGKSKPVIGVVLAVLMIVFFVIANFRDWFLDLQFSVLFEKLLVLLAFVLSLYILNFIAKKNELTRRSAYKILFFALFTTSFYSLMENTQVILANLFLLLSLRRIISLKTKKEMQKKIFDATFWICIASLFYFWSILFLFVVFIGIFYYLPQIKNWLIPSVVFFGVAILTLTFHLLMYNKLYGFWDWIETSNFDFTQYQQLKILVPLSIILAVLIWTLPGFMRLIQKASISMRPSLTLILVALIGAVFVAIFAPTKDGSELIFFFVPLSIIASNYFERKKDKIFKEILLVILILMPFVVPFLG